LDSFAYGLTVEEHETTIKCGQCVAQLLKVASRSEGRTRRFANMNAQMNEATPQEMDPVAPDPLAQGWVRLGGNVVLIPGAFGYQRGK
jgi:hypothetical protein